MTQGAGAGAGAEAGAGTGAKAEAVCWEWEEMATIKLHTAWVEMGALLVGAMHVWMLVCMEATGGMAERDRILLPGWQVLIPLAYLPRTCQRYP